MAEAAAEGNRSKFDVWETPPLYFIPIDHWNEENWGERPGIINRLIEDRAITTPSLLALLQDLDVRVICDWFRQRLDSAQKVPLPLQTLLSSSKERITDFLVYWY